MNLDKKPGGDGSLTFILGGVRSGKSRFGQDLASELGGDEVLFVATAQARDDEMRRRIAQHREARPAAWTTLEQPLGTGQAIAALSARPRVVLVDCLTLLVSNVLLCQEAQPNAAGIRETAEQRMQAELDALLGVARGQATDLIIVSGEVGMGVVPESALGRNFRDLLGWSNQRIAGRASATYWMVAGLPINATALASSAQQAAEQLSKWDRLIHAKRNGHAT